MVRIIVCQGGYTRVTVEVGMVSAAPSHTFTGVTPPVWGAGVVVTRQPYHIAGREKSKGG